MRAFNAQMVQQPRALTDVVIPGERLDTPTGLAIFAPVKQNALEVPGQMVQQLDALVDTQIAPFLDPRIEPTG